MRQFFFIATIFMIVLSSCSYEKNESFTAVQKEVFAKLPADAQFYAFFNVEEAQKAAFLSRFKDSIQVRLEKQTQMQEMFQQTGLEPMKDIQQLFSAGKMVDGKLRSVVAVRGNFNVAQIKAYMAKKDSAQIIQREEINGVDVFSNKNRPQMAFAFSDNSLMFGGDRAMVLAALEPAASGTSRLLNDYGSTIKYKAHAFVYGDIQAMETMVGQSLESDRMEIPEKLLRDIQSVSISMKLNEAMNMAGEGHMQTAEKAELYLDMLKGALSTVKLSVSDERALVDIVNQMKFKSNGNIVTMDFELSQDDVETLREKMNTVENAVADTRIQI
jgi:hypothetical protein